METVTYTRLQLYELVWQQPIQTLARTLGISDVGLAKACRRLSIPLPGRGYWAKVAAGKKLSRVPLLNDPRAESQIRFKQIEKPPKKLLAPLSEKHLPLTSSEPVTMSTLDAPHPLVRKCRARFKSQETDQYELRNVSPVAGLTIRVSAAEETRALVILDTVLKILKRSRIKVETKEKDDQRGNVSTPYLTVAGEELQLSIRESYAKKRIIDAELEEAAGKPSVRKLKFFPNGRLTLSIDNYPREYVSNWTDGATRIESRIADIFQALLAFPDAIARQRELAVEAQRLQVQEQERRWAREQEERRKKAYRQELLNEAVAYKESVLLLEYLSQLEKRAKEQVAPLTPKFYESLAEAKALAATLDPTDERTERLNASTDRCGRLT
jgi:hypothetical protein